MRPGAASQGRRPLVRPDARLVAISSGGFRSTGIAIERRAGRVFPLRNRAATPAGLGCACHFAALMRHPAQIDGFFYRSRLDSGQRCLAVFGRPQLRLHARKRFQPKKTGALLQDLGLLLLLVDEGIGLL